MRTDEIQILHDCVPGLRRYARALTGDATRADDLVQDTLERACRRWSGWRGTGEPRAWLFSIMHNLHVDQLRRSAPQTVDIEDCDEVHDLPARATQTDALELRDLDAALARLPLEQREVLLLVALEGLSYAEVATALGVPAGTVMSRLSRGRERLRQILDGHAGPVRLRAVR